MTKHSLTPGHRGPKKVSHSLATLPLLALKKHEAAEEGTTAEHLSAAVVAHGSVSHFPGRGGGCGEFDSKNRLKLFDSINPGRKQNMESGQRSPRLRVPCSFWRGPSPHGLAYRDLHFGYPKNSELHHSQRTASEKHPVIYCFSASQRRFSSFVAKPKGPGELFGPQKFLVRPGHPQTKQIGPKQPAQRSSPARPKQGRGRTTQSRPRPARVEDAHVTRFHPPHINHFHQLNKEQ